MSAKKSNTQTAAVHLASWEKASYEDFVGMYPVLANLVGCHQHRGFHAEGDVDVHTKMVLEALRAHPGYTMLPEGVRGELSVAAVLHDIGKPETTRKDEAGIWRAPNHAHAGSVRARSLLWRAGVPTDVRERICGLIDHHIHPFHLVGRKDANAVAAAISLTAGCDKEWMLATADVNGRISATNDKLMDALGLYQEWCEQLNCWNQPYPFVSERQRLALLRNPGADWAWDPWDNTRCEVTIMVGIPGSGKSTWIAKNGGGVPVVSLDDIRVELGVSPAGPQGQVVATGRARITELLGAGTSFIYDATNMTKDRRRRVVDAAFAYKARVRMVAVECSETTLRERNRRRERPVPEHVIDAMISHWEAPNLTEAHEVIFYNSETQ